MAVALLYLVFLGVGAVWIATGDLKADLYESFFIWLGAIVGAAVFGAPSMTPRLRRWGMTFWLSALLAFFYLLFLSGEIAYRSSGGETVLIWSAMPSPVYMDYIASERDGRPGDPLKITKAYQSLTMLVAFLVALAHACILSLVYVFVRPAPDEDEIVQYAVTSDFVRALDGEIQAREDPRNALLDRIARTS